LRRYKFGRHWRSSTAQLQRNIKVTGICCKI
jgi:hypothetical protein